jgi:hypothetical protein
MDQIFEPEIKTETFKIEKIKSVKEFKKKYGGGYLGYNNIYNFGNINEYDIADGQVFDIIYHKLINRLEAYLNEIPTDVIYSVLPVLR